MNLQYFNDQDFYFSIKKLFEDLNIPIHYMTEQPALAKDIISNTFKPQKSAHQMIDDVYFLGMVDDRAFNNQPSAIESDRLKEKDYDGLLVFGVTLDREGGKLPTRGQMAEVTRAFNREFHYTPVVIVFKYDRYICFSNCERTPYKQKWREGEKAGKVSLLIDIDTVNTHTGHLKILQNLAIPTSGKKAVTTFNGLYDYWQEVFSVSLLSKRFYQELSTWYFWALKHVEFPDDAEKDRDVRNATSVIRLITRLIFVWFLKEKKLIPNALFDKKELDEHLNYKDYHDSTYYKAILQNLFFATLNTKMKKDDPQSRKFVNRQYGIQEFYRYERFFKNRKKALKLFETIPFLNGGLFENLDKNIGKPDEVRIDGFSNRPVHEKRLRVPDFLFFGAEDQIDLSDVYGSKKRKNETVRGIIHILNSYKFTIAENTPIEEEIALDPELLGKVFENLLASYNPETQTTARKQTGSFYTPREIVNYMVDESLIAYLEGNLIGLYEKKSKFTQKTPPSQKIMFGKQKAVQSKIAPSNSKITAKLKNEANDNLRHLLSYSTEDHPFSKNDVKTIIGALDNAKILDPACGSGAFPMGILHKMVHILSKLDPQNKHWKQRQIKKQTRGIKKDISYAEKIKDNKARQKALDELVERLASINDAFDTNELDFGRKLYLIENCIFGVDIQPIAVQIAKLRFFISLIVDQIVDENKGNLGIIPLPNLETKFVAANTLIGVDKKGQMELDFQNPEITMKEKELAKVRERHFSARTPNTKEKYRQKDENLRNEIAELLKKDGFASDVTQKLAHWNPYDQNTFADFFDMEWMFGESIGFDIVIGNPPYAILSIKNTLESLFDKYKASYEVAQYKIDLFHLFIERGINLLGNDSVLSYIVPNTWLTQKFTLNLRKFLLRETNVLEVVIIDDEVFESSVVNSILVFTKKTFYLSENVKIRNVQKGTKINNIDALPFFVASQSEWRSNPNYTIETRFYGDKGLLAKSIIRNHKTLESDFRASLGCQAYNSSKHTKEQIKNRVFHSDQKLDNTYLPELAGGDVSRYKIQRKRGTWIKYGPWLHDYRSMDWLSGPRILIREVSGKKPWMIQACYVEMTYCNYKTILNINPKHKSKNNKTLMLSLTGIINSTLSSFIYPYISNKMVADSFPRISVGDLKRLPVASLKVTDQKLIAILVRKMIDLKLKGNNEISIIEAEIDGRVAHLYNLTEEEYSLVLKETNCPDPFRVAALNVYRDIARGKKNDRH